MNSPSAGGRSVDLPDDALIDSHCHIDFPDLIGDITGILSRMADNRVVGAVCVSVRLEDLPNVLRLAESHSNIWATVGVHPDSEACMEPSVDDLVRLAEHPRVLAVGETGLDYYRLQGDLEWQRHRFRTHIRAARESGKPLVIHTRESAPDTIRILREEKAGEIGGIMHCFTESLETAWAAVDLGFYVSFSGILSFKSAESLREVAKALPRDRLLIETDSPYLAPVPKRGKRNEPAFVRHVADCLADVRREDRSELARATTENFRRLFASAI